MLPSVVVREIDDDPMHYNLACLELLRYASAKHALDTAKDEKALKPWAKSKHMAEAKRILKSLRAERKERAERERAEQAASASAKRRG